MFCLLIGHLTIRMFAELLLYVCATDGTRKSSTERKSRRLFSKALPGIPKKLSFLVEQLFIT